MNKRAVIIHPFEIVRKGLSAIIRAYFNIEVTVSEKPSGKDVIFPKDCFTFLFLYEPFHSDSLFQQINISNQNFTIILIFDENKILKHSNNPMPNISMQSTSLEIHDTINSLLSKIDASNLAPPEENELTTREKEILRHIALGHTNKDTADQLFISTHTVISHRKNITEKLGIKSISGLTVYAILNNIINTEGIDIRKLI